MHDALAITYGNDDSSLLTFREEAMEVKVSIVSIVEQ